MWFLKFKFRLILVIFDISLSKLNREIKFRSAKKWSSSWEIPIDIIDTIQIFDTRINFIDSIVIIYAEMFYGNFKYNLIAFI